MVRHEERVHVAAAPDAVWAVMSEVARWPEWTPTVTRVESLTGPGLAVGARFRLRQPKLPPVVWTVDAVRPGRSFSWTASSPGVRSSGDHRVEPAPGGSLAVLVFEQSGPLAGLSALFYARLVRRYVRTEGEGLKRAAERRDDARAGGG